MTPEQFNEKYKAYLGEHHYGLSFDDPAITDMLDKEFQEFIKRPGFKYYQIKLKFGYARFYADGITAEEQAHIECRIDEMRRQREANIS